MPEFSLSSNIAKISFISKVPAQVSTVTLLTLHSPRIKVIFPIAKYTHNFASQCNCAIFMYKETASFPRNLVE